MADGLVHWLEEHIATQLDLARSWLNARTDRTQQGIKQDPDRAWTRLFQDNGSCIDIIDDVFPERSSTLQIFKVNPLTLTDGAALIEAYFEPGYHSNPPEPFHTEPHYLATPNSLLVVREFTIRYTPYGPPREQLSFILHSVDWRGEGVHLGSVAPEPIASCVEVSAAVKELRDTRLQSDRQCFLSDQTPVDIMAPSQRRADEDPIGTQSSPNTQMAYGTQMLHPIRNRTPVDVQFPGTNRTEPVLASNSRREQLRPDIAPSDAEKQAKLLKLLKFPRPQNVGPSMAPIAAPSQIPSVAPSAGDFMRVSKTNDHVQASTPGGLSMSPSTPNQQDHSHNRHLDDPRPFSTPIERHGNGQLTPDSNQGRGRPLDAPIEYRPADQRITDSSQGTGKSFDSVMAVEPQSTNSLLSNGPHSSFSDEDDLDDIEPEWLQGLRPLCTSADVSKDQRSLLSNPSSWHKPLPGNRFPDGNIPIEMMTSFRELAMISTEPIASSPLAPCYQDEELSHSECTEDADADVPPTQISWSRSPTPEPPKPPFRKNLDLPPDSSFDDGKSIVTHEDLEPKPAQEGRQPIMIVSSNEQSPNNPPSSPPLVSSSDDSDQEMDMQIPRGLGEDWVHHEHPSPKHVQTTPVVQVKETPYVKKRSDAAILTARQQRSSGTSKETPSASMVHGTYNELNSLGISHRVERETPSSTPMTHITQGNNNTLPSQLCEDAAPALTPRHVRFPSTAAHDVSMEDAPPDSLLVSGATELNQAMAKASEDLEMSVAQPEPSQIFAQRPILSSSGEQASLPATIEPEIAQANNPKTAHTKRKLDNSPSKKSNRHPKRREIKIVAFGSNSPVRDTAAEVRQWRKESLQQFREERQSLANVAGPLENEHHNDSRSHESAPFTRSLNKQTSAELQPTTSSVENETSVPNAAMEIDSPVLITVFQSFKNAYPEYTANTQHFVRQCKDIYELDLEDKMVPKWQWDDYIIRSRTDYKDYNLQCLENGDDPEPYHRFYKDNIRDTLHRKGVIESRKTLLTALQELNVYPPGAASTGASPVKKPTRKSLPWGVHQANEPAADDIPSSAGTQSRRSLPAVSHKALPTLLGRDSPHKSSSPKPPSHNTSYRSSPSTPTTPHVPTEPTGDQYRDFVFAYHRVTSLTGSTKIDAKKSWPENLAVRPVAGVPRKGYDVLKWGDEA